MPFSLFLFTFTLFPATLLGLRTCCINIDQAKDLVGCNEDCSSKSLAETFSKINSLDGDDFQILLKSDNYNNEKLDLLKGSGSIKSLGEPSNISITLNNSLFMNSTKIEIDNIRMIINDLVTEDIFQIAGESGKLTFTNCIFDFKIKSDFSQSSKSVFKITANATLVFNNIIINNLVNISLINSFGGYINLTACTFTGGSHGQIFTSLTTKIQITLCKFYSLDSVTNLFLMKYRNHLNISNCDFKNLQNTSIFDNMDSYSNMIAIQDSKFSDFNNVNFLIIYNRSAINIKNSSFSNFGASQNAGFLKLGSSNCNLSINGSVIKNFNYSELYLFSQTGSKIEVYNTLVDNILIKEKGDLFLMSSYSNLISINSTIRNYDSKLGFLYVNMNSQIFFQNTTILNVSMKDDSTFIYLVEKNQMTITESTFINISIFMKYRGDTRGGIYLKTNNNLNISNCRFEINSTGEGGVVKAVESNNILLLSSSFVSSQAGALYLGQDNTLNITGRIEMTEYSNLINLETIGIILKAQFQNFIKLENASLLIKIYSDNGILLNLYERNNLLLLNTTFNLLVWGTDSSNLVYRKTLASSLGSNTFNVSTFESNSAIVLTFMNLGKQDLLYMTNSTISSESSLVNLFRVDGSDVISIVYCSVKSTNNYQPEVEKRSPFQNLAAFENVNFLKISNCNFSDFTTNFSLLHIKSTRTAEFNNLLFMNNNVSSEGALMKFQNTHKLDLTDSLFIKNKCRNKGVVFIDNITTLSVSGNKFESNSVIGYDVGINETNLCTIDEAKSKGGALFVSNSSLIRNSIFKISNNIFVNNKADIANNIYFHLVQRDSLAMENNSYNNSSLPNGLSSNVKALLLLLNKSESEPKFAVSNQRTIPGTPLINLSMIDLFDQIISNRCLSHIKTSLANLKSYPPDLKLTLMQDLTYPNNTSFLMVSGFKEIDKDKSPKTEKGDMFITFLDTLSNLTLGNYNLSYDLKIGCQNGTLFKSNSCEICPTDTFKLAWNLENTCDRCQSRKMSSCENGQMVLKDGYYMTPYTSEILRCKFSQACIESKCGKNFEQTFLCSKCKSTYGLTPYWDCVDCDDVFPYFIMFLYVIIFLFIQAYTVRKGFKLTKNLRKKVGEKIKSEFNENYTVFDLAATNSCIKIMMIHYAFIMSLLSYPFPALDYINRNSKLNILKKWPFNFSFQCFFKKIGFHSSHVYVGVFLRLTAPIAIIVLWTIYYWIKLLYRRRQKRIERQSHYIPNDDPQSTRRTNFSFKLTNQKENFLNRVIIFLMEKNSFESIVLVTVTVCLDDIITALGQIFSMFTTEEYPGGVKIRMLWDPEKDWWESNNRSAVVISGLLALGIGVFMPTYILKQLRKFKNNSKKTKASSEKENQDSTPNKIKEESEKLNKYTLFLKYGYFYYPYNKNCFYYEIIYMLKRLVFLVYNVYIIPLVYLHTKYEQNIVAFINFEILMIWIFFLIHLFLKPYREELQQRSINRLETKSFIVLLTSFLISSLFFNDLDLEEKNDTLQKDINNILLYGGIYFSNILFFLYGLYRLYIYEKYNIEETWGMFKDIAIYIYELFKNCLLSMRKKKEQKLKKLDSKRETKLRRGIVLGRFEKDRIKSIIKFEEIALTLNPLATWRKKRDQKEIKQKIIAEADKTMKNLTNYYKKKMLLLKLRIQLLKKENTNLREKLKNFEFGEAFNLNGSFEEEKKISDNINFSNLKVKKVLEGSCNDFDPGRELEEIPDSVQEEINCQEIPPNKLRDDQRSNSPDSYKEFIPSPSGANFIEYKPGGFGARVINLESLEKKLRFESSLALIFNKEIVAKSFSVYFLKIKLIIKNEFGDLSEINIVTDKSSDNFLKIKKRKKLEKELQKEACLNLTIYFRSLLPSAQDLSSVSFLVKAKGDNHALEKKFEVPIAKVDYLFMESLPAGPSSKNDFDFEGDLNYVEKNFTKVFKRKIPFEQSEDPSIFESLRYNFPEIFKELEESKKRNELIFKDGKKGTFNKNFMSMTCTDSVKSPNMEVQLQPQLPQKPVKSRIFSKRGKLVFLLRNLFLNFHVYNEGNEIIIKFKRLFVKLDFVKEYCEQDIKKLLEEFIKERNF